MEEINDKIPHEVSGELYEQVFDRDAECCRSCGSPYFLECHHIVNRGAGGDSDICNLVMLCKDCHLKAGSGRSEWSKSKYDDLIHILPCEAFIHAIDFTKIKCQIHDKFISS